MECDFEEGTITCCVCEQSHLAFGHFGAGENHLDNADSLAHYPKQSVQPRPVRSEGLG